MTTPKDFDSTRIACEVCGMGVLPGVLPYHICTGPGRAAASSPKGQDALLAALIEARDMVADWATYAGDYFQDKHDLAGDLAKLDAIIASHSAPPTPAAPTPEGTDGPEWTCTECGSTDGVQTVVYDTPGEPRDYDARCLACGSTEVEESLRDALLRVIDQRDEALSLAQRPTHEGIDDGWIACEDRMPEDGVLVLLLHQCADWKPEPWKHTFGQVVDNGETWCWADENDNDQDWELVTHWRPLPAPPTRSSKGDG